MVQQIVGLEPQSSLRSMSETCVLSFQIGWLLDLDPLTRREVQNETLTWVIRFSCGPWRNGNSLTTESPVTCRSLLSRNYLFGSSHFFESPESLLWLYKEILQKETQWRIFKFETVREVGVFYIIRTSLRHRFIFYVYNRIIILRCEIFFLLNNPTLNKWYING